MGALIQQQEGNITLSSVHDIYKNQVKWQAHHCLLIAQRKEHLTSTLIRQ